MSTERDVTGIVRAWLEVGPTSLPDRVLDDVLERLPDTPQRRPWWPVGRSRRMAHLRVAVAAAAICLVAVIGVSVLPREQTASYRPSRQARHRRRARRYPPRLG